VDIGGVVGAWDDAENESEDSDVPGVEHEAYNELPDERLSSLSERGL